jgi:hypothetical protein
MRNTMRKAMLGVALVAGLVGTGVAKAAPQEFRGRVAEGYRGPAEHREFAGREFAGRGEVRGREFGGDYRTFRPRFGTGFGVAVGAPVVGYDAYIPPCPGDGYFWTAGYYNGGVWVPGAWRLRGGYAGRGFGYERGFRDNHLVAERRFEGGRGFAHGERGFGGRR